MAETVVKSFQAIADKGERLKALQDLVQILTFEERSAMKAAISQRNDIVTALPFELSISIFRNLDPLDVWRLQSVCRAWRSRLSSADFLRDAVSRWATHDDRDDVRSKDAVANDSLEDRIRHIRAFQNAQPFSWKEVVEEGFVGDVLLRGRRVAYEHHNRISGYDVTVHDLCSGIKDVCRPESRDAVANMVLTNALVAFTTIYEAKLFYKRFADADPPLQHIRLPSASMAVIGGDGDYIVMFPSRYLSGARAGTVRLLVFDAAARHLEAFDVAIDHGSRHDNDDFHPRRVLVDAKRRIIDVFAAASTDGWKHTEIKHVRLALDGTVIHQRPNPYQRKIYMLPALPGATTHNISRPYNIGSEGLFAMAGFGYGRVDGDPVFDAVVGDFVDEDELRPKMPTLNKPYALWKGSVFCSVFSAARNLYHGADRQFGPLQSNGSGDWCQGILQRLTKQQQRGEGELPRAKELTRQDEITVNDTFLVSTREREREEVAIRVFCFDEQVRMEGGQTTGLWDDRKDDEERGSEARGHGFAPA